MYIAYPPLGWNWRQVFINLWSWLLGLLRPNSSLFINNYYLYSIPKMWVYLLYCNWLNFFFFWWAGMSKPSLPFNIIVLQNDVIAIKHHLRVCFNMHTFFSSAQQISLFCKTPVSITEPIVIDWTSFDERECQIPLCHLIIVLRFVIIVIKHFVSSQPLYFACQKYTLYSGGRAPLCCS